MTYRIVICVSLVCSLACSTERGESEPLRRAAIAEGRIHVDSVAAVDIGGPTESGEPAVLLPAHATRLASGVIVVADYAAPALLFFNASGRLIRKVGRAGGGPGEFRNLSWVGRCELDSVFAWDPMQHRVSVFDAAGRFAREYRLPGNPVVVKCSPHGTFALLMWPRNMSRPDPSGKSPRFTAPLLLANTVGDSILSLGEVPVGESRPLGRVTRIAIAGDRLYVGTADSAFVDVYGLDGQHLPSLAVGVTPRVPTPRNYERAIDRMVSGFTNRDGREAMKKQLLKIPMPDRLPPYTGLFTESSGTLWVVTSSPGDTATQLRAITPGGDILGDVRLPVEIRIFEVGPDYILGTYEAKNGEPHVAMYHIHLDR